MAKLAVILVCCLFAVLSEARSTNRELYLFRRFIQKRNEAALAPCVAHINSLRKKHGAGPLSWGKYESRDAEKWLKNGKVAKDPQDGTSDTEGELIVRVPGGGSPAEKCIKAVNHWYSELGAYKSGGGCGSKDGVEGARAFSQLVWKSSDVIGLAVSGDLVDARFFPEGNIEEDFDEDVQC